MLAKSCAAEITANCRGVNINSDRLKECLYRNQDVMSPQCKTNYLGAFDAIQKRIAARVTVAQACELRNRQAVPRLDQGDQQIGAVPDDGQGRQPQLHQAMVDAGYR